MEEKKAIWFRRISLKSSSIFNRDLFVFAFFLFLSFIFWYLNALRKDIDTELRYPVRYINPPKDMVVSKDMPSRITLNLKGPGYSIMMLKISGNRAPVIIDFSKILLERMPGYSENEKYIVSSRLIPDFSKQLKSEFQIVSIKPDTLEVSFEKKSSSSNTSELIKTENDSLK